MATEQPNHVTDDEGRRDQAMSVSVTFILFANGTKLEAEVTMEIL